MLMKQLPKKKAQLLRSTCFLLMTVAKNKRACVCLLNSNWSLIYKQINCFTPATTTKPMTLLQSYFLCLFLLFANFRSQSKILSYNNLYFNCVMTTTLKDNGRGQIFFFFASIAFPCFVGENNMNGKIVVSETRKCFLLLFERNTSIVGWECEWNCFLFFCEWNSPSVVDRVCLMGESQRDGTVGIEPLQLLLSLAIELSQREKANIELDKLSSN